MKFDSEEIKDVFNSVNLNDEHPQMKGFYFPMIRTKLELNKGRLYLNCKNEGCPRTLVAKITEEGGCELLEPSHKGRKKTVEKTNSVTKHLETCIALEERILKPTKAQREHIQYQLKRTKRSPKDFIDLCKEDE